jgi:hypothetical protein
MRERYDLSYFEGIAVERRRAPWLFSAPVLLPAFVEHLWPNTRLTWTYQDAEPSISWRFVHTNHWEW